MSAQLSRLPHDEFSRGFQRSVSLWLLMNDLNQEFRSLKGRCHSYQFVFSATSFSRRNPKTTQDRHIGNVGNFVFWRLAPSVMTSGDLECQNCFRSSPICSKSTRPIFAVIFSPVGSATCVDDCCEIALQSVKGRCYGKIVLLFSDSFRQIRTLFCYAQTPLVGFVVLF